MQSDLYLSGSRFYARLDAAAREELGATSNLVFFRVMMRRGTYVGANETTASMEFLPNHIGSRASRKITGSAASASASRRNSRPNSFRRGSISRLNLHQVFYERPENSALLIIYSEFRQQLEKFQRHRTNYADYLIEVPAFAPQCETIGALCTR